MNNWITNNFPLAYPPDSDEQEKLRIRLAFMASLFNGISVCTYAILIIAYGEVLAGLIWLAWGLYCFLAVMYYLRVRRLVPSVFVIQALFCLLEPLVVDGLLGSYVRLGYFNFALMAPIVALVWLPKQFWGWVSAYIITFLFTLWLDPYLTLSPRLPVWVIYLWFGGSMLCSGMIALLLIWYMLQQRNHALSRLAEEQALTESLLLNVLPESIAQRLKMNPFSGQIIADQTDEASILFADVVDFTPLSTRIGPQELISLLDRLFTRFDELTDQFGLEKIKTVGDCYMVAAGVPLAQPDHALIITRLALAMQKTMTYEIRPDGRPLAIRIGINSGEVIAGVIGRKKFIYDLWGDAVNVASRMESHGSAGAVQITQPTYERVKAHFICEPRGVIEVKGKGPMEIWHVVGERAG